ncbi:MAG TPA: hypothetical protein VD926_07070 [Acidimicrobiales bacterium]|nr:hypothetical protein [Acidimicrobiales bacterium]
MALAYPENRLPCARQTVDVPTSTVEVPQRYQGPPDSANGGYVVGLLAAPFGRSATVRLEASPPLETPLRLEVGDDESSLWLDDRRLAVGHAHEGPLPPGGPVDPTLAAGTVGPTAEQHAFPNCFVCGPTAPEGLHVCPGPLPDGSAVATTWTPDPEGAGLDVDWLTWAVLDCPSGLAAMQDRVPAVLGTLTGHIDRTLAPGEPIVVVGRLTRIDGRKRFATTALYDASGTPVAWAEAVWIALGR